MHIYGVWNEYSNTECSTVNLCVDNFTWNGTEQSCGGLCNVNWCDMFYIFFSTVKLRYLSKMLVD